MFVPLLALIFNQWLKNGTIPSRFTRGVIKLLRKDKKAEGMGLDNYPALNYVEHRVKDFGQGLS